MNITTIDWLGARSQSNPNDCIEALRDSFGLRGALISTTHNQRGWNGFEQSQTISVAHLRVGQIAYGGNAMRGWVRFDLTGVGCGLVEDWDSFESDMSALDKFETRRVDIALDTFKRESSHEQVVSAYRDGLFTTSGRPPSMLRLEPEDPTEGRTVNVGKRDQPKFFRGYEKGHEECKKYPGLEIKEFHGIPKEDWYRLELELKAKHQPLPVDLIENRDQFFSGAFPYLQTVIAAEPLVLRMSRDKAAQRSMDSMLGLIKTQYGSALYTCLVALNGDVGALMDRIIGDKHNESLLQDGVLMVDHE